MSKTPSLNDLVKAHNDAEAAHRERQVALQRQIEILQLSTVSEALELVTAMGETVERLRPLLDQLTDHRANVVAHVTSAHDNALHVLKAEQERIDQLKTEGEAQ